MMKIIAFMLLFLFSSEIQAATKRNEDPYFHFEKIEGDVKFWIPLSAKWRTLRKGLKLPVGTILQISVGSSVSLKKFTKFPHGWSGNRMYIKTNEAINLRLEEQMLRRLNLKEHFLSELVEEDDEIEKIKKKLSTKEIFQDAWDRVSVFLSSEDKKKVEQYISELTKDTSFDFDIGTSYKEVKMNLPINGQLLMSENFPTSVQVNWENNDPNKYYSVYLWNSQESKGQPYATIPGDRMVVQVPKAGSYFLQVMSQDKTEATKPALIHVDKYNFERIESESKKFTLKTDKLIYPPDEFLMLTDNKTRNVKFYWEISEPKFLNAKLNIKNSNKNSLQQIEMDREKQNWELELIPDKYEWWISYDYDLTEDMNGKKISISTNIFHFAIKKVEKNQNLTEIIKGTNLPTHIYLDHGF